MKTKTLQKVEAQLERPFHLHLEYFFRHQYFLLAMMGLVLLAVIKTDGRVITMLRQAYAQGFGIVGQYMREETTRVPITFDIAVRVPTQSGK
jgi:hypothetical protein